MFKAVIEQTAGRVTVVLNGVRVPVPATFTAAAAMLSLESCATRSTPVSNAPRAPYCMMGVCFECLMEINGVPNQQACLIPVAEGMTIDRQHGARVAYP